MQSKCVPSPPPFHREPEDRVCAYLVMMFHLVPEKDLLWLTGRSLSCRLFREMRHAQMTKPNSTQ